MNVYFVCTGNTCRSPMAAAILKHKNVDNIQVKSAGVYAIDGAPMSENAQAVLNEEGIDVTHSSQLFSQDDIQWADVILTMTAAHKQIILQMYPEAWEKTFTLTEYIEKPHLGDVLDPFGGSISQYKNTFDELNQYIDEATSRLRKES